MGGELHTITRRCKIRLCQRGCLLQPDAKVSYAPTIAVDWRPATHGRAAHSYSRGRTGPEKAPRTLR